MEKRSRNLLIISASTAWITGTIAVGMAAHAISKQKQPFVSLPWFMGKYEREERIQAINNLLENVKNSESIKRKFKSNNKTSENGSSTSYICFGDDAPYGINLIGKDGYPELVAKKLNVSDFHNYACRTFGSNEIRKLVDNSYKIPDNFKNIHNVLFNEETNTEVIREIIKKADLITLDFGHVDFCYYLFYRILDRAGIPVNCIPEIRIFFEKGKNSKAFKRIINIKNEFDKISETLEEPNPNILNFLVIGTHIGIASVLSLFTATRIIHYSLISFIEIEKNFITNEKNILKEIKKLNENAEIIMLGSYNPFRNVKLKETSKKSIGRLLTPLYRFLNLLMQIETKDNCTYISQTIYPAETPEWTIESASKNPVGWAIEKIGMRQNRNPLFPSEAGHIKIANTILKKSKKINKKSR